MVNGSRVWMGLFLMASLALAGCNDEGDSALAAGASAAPAAGASGNAAPTISGTAVTSIAAGSPYSFTPAAVDANGDALTFTIENKPSWATFSTVNGKLTGVPTAANVGSYANVLIRVSDGKATATLAAFSIAVTQIGAASANLSWMPPTENVDGTPLVDLAGYQILYGTHPDELTQTVKITNASINRYLVENLSPATWYFAIKAYNAAGVESSSSAVASKRIG